MTPTNVPKLISELGSGVFENKLATVISQVASAALEHQRVGEVSIKLKLSPAGSANQLMVAHTVAYKQPKKRGTIGEDDTQDTIMFVNDGGDITLFPANQVDMFHPDNLPARAPENK